MREVKINRVPFNPKGTNNALPTERVPFEPNRVSPGFDENSFSLEDDILNKNANDIVNTLKQTGRKNGYSVDDHELETLKNILVDPRATSDQKLRSLKTIQGTDPKHTDDNVKYYNKLEENGVYVPTALGLGERPPQGYKVASIWGSQSQADDDDWYTDMGKSLANGVFGAAEGVLNVAQVANTLITGEESKRINNLRNAADALKFEKSKDLNVPLYNTEGINSFGDLVDKDRFDLSGKALWGTLNMAAESLTSFYLGGRGASSFIKNSPKLATFTGSFMSQLGDNLDNAEEAGLKGRDKAAVATLITAPMAATDALFGLEGKLMSNVFKDAKKELVKNAVKAVEKDVTGNITEQGFKELAKITTAGYTQIAKNGVKEIVKDIVGEGTQEAIQDFTQKAGEQLWDKLSSEEKEKFGTDAFDAKSFGSYIQNLGAGLVGGAPMSVVNYAIKDKHDQQSETVYDRVKQGKEAVNALKTDLTNSFNSGEINKDEFDNALFKINAYQNYYSLTQKYDMKPEDEKKAFELSFQIEGLNTEIPTDTQKIHSMNPIERSEIKSKEVQKNKLQDELNNIILKSQIKTEPVVAQKIENDVQKEREEELSVESDERKEREEEFEKSKENISNLKQEVEKPVRRKLDETPVEEFNQLSSLSKKQTVQEYLKDKPDKSMLGKIVIEENGKHAIDLGGGKYVTLASSVEGDKTKPSIIRRENLPKTKVTGRYFISEGKIKENRKYNEKGEANMPITSFEEPVIIKRDEIDAYNYDPKTGVESLKLKDGQPSKKAILNVYNSETGKYIVSIREKDKKGFTKYKPSEYSPSEIKQMQDIQERGVSPLIEEDERFGVISETTTPEIVEETPQIVEVSKEPIKISDTESAKKEEENGHSQPKEEPKHDKVETTTQTIERLKIQGYEEFEIERAVDEANRLLMLNNSDFTRELQNKGMFNSVGQTNEFRIDTRGLSTQQVNSAIKNIVEGKKDDSVAVKTFKNEVINKIKRTGNAPFISGTGGMTNRYDIPLFELLLEKGLGEREVTPTDISELETEEAYKSGKQQKKTLEQKINSYKANLSEEHHADVLKVTQAIQKSMPKINVKYNPRLKSAGLFIPANNTIEINPYYAGRDTPIHEAGHVLIDAMGYYNKIIQAAIKQLKSAPIYEETKKRYPELNNRDLDVEVLAEAIGIEGANIFDNTVAKNKFQQYLDYIFDWLKRKLGLEKNVAKSLARQIISGVKTNRLTAKKNEVSKEQKLKEGEKVKSYSEYRNSIGRDYDIEKQAIEDAEYTIENSESEEEVELAQATIDQIRKQRKDDSKAYTTYIKSFNDNLSEYSTNELVNLYNQVKALNLKNDKSQKELRLAIALKLRKERQSEISKEYGDYIESIANKKDIGAIDVWFLNQSHFTEHQPEMQQAIKHVQNAQLDMVKEASKLKSTNETLAKRVIKEENERLGITGAIKSLYTSDSAKYFEWMDNGEGGLITLDEAKQKGYSKAKQDYLSFTRELLAERKGLEEANNFENADMDVIRIDKTFRESRKADGIAQAFSYYLGGGGANLGDLRIMYNGEPKAFKDIEKDILANVDRKNIKSVVKALIDLLRYNFTARKQLKRGFNVDEKINPLEVKGNAQYSLNYNGQLVSKFDKPRNKDRGYSKDFYRAMIEYIDDTTHVKHISPVLGIVDAIEYLNKNGYTEGDIQIKPNVAKWIDEWKKLHIFKESYVNDPTLDTVIKTFRKLTAATTMWFNLPANLINVAVGNYNSFRQENGKTILKGNKRLLGKNSADRKYALDIIRKYHIVNEDFDSNPKIGLGKIFDKLSTIGTKVGEYQIQGSLGLGLMSDEDFNSFEYKNDKYGVPQLVVKDGVDEKTLNDRMIGIKNRVTDIQGKYPDADRRNIMRGEIGKAAFQFKVWMPDWFKERFGAKYINSRNQVRQGSFNALVDDGFKQLKSDIKEKGLTKGLWENKSFMSNIKGLMAITTLLIWKYQDDDDENKRKKSTLAENTLGQVLFILDPEQLKYTLSNPVAALGKMKDFVSAAEALVTLEKNSKDEYTADDKFKRVLPANKISKLGDLASEIIE